MDTYFDDVQDFLAIDDYIEEEDWPLVMEWAENHHQTTDPVVADKVMHCYELCMEHGFPEASLNLGTFYYNGVFVDQDFQKAFELYHAAAEHGILRAICNCGYCFYYGRHQEKDYAEAYKYFDKGALLYDDAECLYKLGDMYVNGYYVEQNESYAFMLYSRAFEQAQDDTEALPDAQLRLGKCYLYGWGVEPDYELSYMFLSLSLIGLYKRRAYDPFVKGVIAKTKKLLAEVQEELEYDMEENFAS